MSDHILDRPIWNALASRHAPFATGTARAMRYPYDVSPFVAAEDDSKENLAELVGLLPETGPAVLLQAKPSPLPEDRVVVSEAGGVQMVATRLKPAPALEGVIELGDADAPEMLELATMTKPGPFLARTHRLGGFVGIREGGRLVAMAGRRLHLDGYCEVSAVCTHPDHRGRGHAGLLTLIVANRIADEGETPFLHTYADNAAAIRLYEQLGFSLRSGMTVQIVERA